MPVTEDSVPQLRRNGLPWSCEPCRRGKHRCDHTRPTCNRCLRRGDPQSCVYHPAPMKHRTPSKRREPRTPSSLQPQVAVNGVHARYRDVGFLGPTAFNADFDEIQERAPVTRTELDSASGRELHEKIVASRRSRRRLDTGFVLDLLREAPWLNEILDHSTTDRLMWSITRPWAQMAQQSIKDDLLAKFNLDDGIERGALINLLRANAATPVKLPSDLRLRDFSSHYTGEKLCWEIIGVYLTACGLSLLGQNHHVGGQILIRNVSHDKQHLVFRIFEASDIVVSLCNESVTSGSDLGFWLLIDNCIHATQVLGDAHFAVWSKLGDIATAVFARGLHEDSDKIIEPFWLMEVRRRALSQAYAMDKMLSTFVGRPPRISKRYCNIHIPLDLELVDLTLDDQALKERCLALDPAGWRLRNSSHTDKLSASVRMFTLGALLREETLELCLSPSRSDIRGKANDLIRRSQQLYTSFPVWLRYNREAQGVRPPETTFMAIEKYLDNVYNEFMLRRLLVRHLHDDPADLVMTAHHILEAIMETKNLQGTVQNGPGVPWVIVLYGLPAAGVLALEVLQLKSQIVSHARIKQNLCTFISYLKWVHVPGDGNYTLAVRGWETLQRIMDSVLAPEALAPRTPIDPSAGPESSEQITEGLPSDFGMFDFAWLDPRQFDENLWDGLDLMVSHP